MTATDITLSLQDRYVLARALVGLGWQGLPCSPLARLLLSNVSEPDDLQALRHLLGTTGLQAVIQVDPHGPAPEDERRRAGEVNVVPALPAAAQLTADQQQQAAEVGGWLEAYVGWAGHAANETPLAFRRSRVVAGSASHWASFVYPYALAAARVLQPVHHVGRRFHLLPQIGWTEPGR
jgi:hypothetical protein